MTDFLLCILLPSSLAGSLFTLCCLALAPLMARLKASFKRAVLVAAALLFLLPLPALAALPAEEAPGAGSGEHAAIGRILRQTAPVSGMYQTGRRLAGALDGETLSPEPEVSGGQTGSGRRNSGAAAAFAALWAAGAGAMAGCGLFGYLRFMLRLRAASLPESGHGARMARYRAVCGEMGIKNPPRLWRSEAVEAPLLAGVLFPRVVLPAGGMDEDALTHALRHELSHYHRGDLAFKLLMLLAGAAHWFNPAAHLLRRAFSTACEQSCDEAVTAAYTPAQRRAYADTLLHFAGPPSVPSAVSAFGSPKKQLRERMKRLMKPIKSPRLLRAAGAALPALLACAALLAGCALSAGALDNGSAEPSAVSSAVPAEAGGGLPAESGPAVSAGPAVSSEPAISSGPITSGPAGTESNVVESGTAGNEPENLPDDTGFIFPVPDMEGISRTMSTTHRGVDFKAPLDTPIYAMQAGTVITADWNDSYGFNVIIEHPEGLRTLYAHCNSLHVAEGNEVTQGQLIATVGNTGNTTGLLCHLEMHDADGNLLDPLEYIVLPG